MITYMVFVQALTIGLFLLCVYNAVSPSCLESLIRLVQSSFYSSTVVIIILRDMLLGALSISHKCALVSNVVFWAASLIGLYADHLAGGGDGGGSSKTSNLLRKCKLQPNKFLSQKENKDLIQLASFNMIFVAVFICCPLFEFLWNKIIQRHTHTIHRLEETDDWIWHQELLLKIPIHVIITEIGFYFFHYLLHYSTFLYKHIHKVHHRFIAPTAMACVYAHPIEFAIGNIFPIYLGPMITNAHPVTCYLFWFPMAMIGTCIGHCGYSILGHVDPHDVHHRHFQYNYGGMYLLDYIFGTMLSGEEHFLLEKREK